MGNKIAHRVDWYRGARAFYTLGNCITNWVNVRTKTHCLKIFRAMHPKLIFLVIEKPINYKGLVLRTHVFHSEFECSIFSLNMAKIESSSGSILKVKVQLKM